MAAALLCGGAGAAAAGSGEAPKTPPAAPAEPPDLGDFEPSDEFCRAIRQAPQERLMRRYYRTECGDAKTCKERHDWAIRYRTEHYGYVKRFGRPEWNPHPPQHYARTGRFMGRRVRLNAWVLPALRCAERDVEKECATCTPDPALPGECDKTFPYRPGNTSTLRDRNTFGRGEVSNHMYGIAIDFEPSRNTCCFCTAKWREHPLCKKDLPLHLRMVLPMSWVPVFERYGFYWLGHDKLQDTMHFEFLGDPTLVRKTYERLHPVGK